MAGRSHALTSSVAYGRIRSELSRRLGAAGAAKLHSKHWTMSHNLFLNIPHSYVSKISNKTVLERSGRQEISNILTYPCFVFWGRVPILLVIDVRKQCMFSGRIFQPRIVEQQQRRGRPKKILGVQDVLTCKRCGTGAGLDKALLY